MIFWILVGLMSVLALAFVLLPIVKPGMGRKPLLIVGVTAGLPLLAILAYQKLGTPGAVVAPQPAMMPPMQQMAAGQPGAMPADHAKNMMNMDLGQLADRLAAKLKANPENADGWALLARTYVEIKRHKDALPAFEKASAMLPKDAQLMADYADALAIANGGKFEKQSRELIATALKLDPANAKGLMLKATLDFNDKNYSQAIESWEKILKLPGVSAETTKEARGSIDEAKKLSKQAK